MIEAQITIIKFKRERSCYVLPLLLDVEANKTKNYVVQQLVSAINSSGGLALEDVGTESVQEGIQLSADDIQLALPKIREDPYSNQWVPVDDDSVMQTVTFNDHDTIAFKHSDDAAFRLQRIEYQE